jgi:hypothetical protein
MSTSLALSAMHYLSSMRRPFAVMVYGRSAVSQVHPRSRLWFGGVLSCGLFFVAGCGSGEPFDYIPVSGTVAYEDGTPIPASGLQLRFDSLDAKPVGEFHPLPGKAIVDSSGAFAQVTTHKFGDGLVPGKHKVSFAYATDAKGKLLVPEEYTHPSTTPLVVDTDQLPLEIKAPRP